MSSPSEASNESGLILSTEVEEMRGIRPFPNTSLETAGQLANQVAGHAIYNRYLSQKSANTLKRHARDLELFAEYLLDVGIMPEHGADFQTNPKAWLGVTWGIVEGFIAWQLQEGYAVTTVNARLSTVKVYAQMAVKAGTVPREEGMLIQSVKGFSRSGAANVDAKRPQTRIKDVTYTYKPDGQKQTVVVSRRNTKKRHPVLLTRQDAHLLRQVRNDSPQAVRDALLVSLLLDHGLRASELALLKASDINLTRGTIHFYRPKVKGTAHEWTTHKLTQKAHELCREYLNQHYPPTLLPDGPLILTTTRLKRNGAGGQLLQKGMNRVRLSERVAWLGKQIGLSKLSAHDCRHFCATQMAQMGYGVDELMAWFGWTSAQTAVRYIASAEVQKRYKG
ncbi:tyrosine-type recombinase/integrase [Candidatus Leptofilum sp.]|uniref:tyrosine-type recombinase/integrase n=1 Tax=Candidatus Leptofilum sp. TaxID=3241576 RepID=UPI003B5BED2B